MTLRELLEDVKLSADNIIFIFTICGYNSIGGYVRFEDEVYNRQGGYSIYETLEEKYLDYKIILIRATSKGELRILIDKDGE
jgi:hypothetical protein